MRRIGREHPRRPGERAADAAWAAPPPPANGTPWIKRILRADTELRPWLPELLSVYRQKGARRLPPLIRDSLN